MNEEYLYSLPDYVNGKLPDGPLKSGIEEMIKSDAVFRAEYESMLNTMKFVRNGSLVEPPEHYFNSLVPRINERIEAGNTRASSSISCVEIHRSGVNRHTRDGNYFKARKRKYRGKERRYR
ncbi:MAG: hypothetical protein LWX07_13305 [Bacteroidetes bacterium]|nr:hypothetical protein [Bacteroidota bacterium]